MNATADELAGVVELFGGLTRAELERALSEAAYRADGQSVDEDALETAIEEALAAFALVRYDGSEADAPLLVAGPTAFPTVPNHAEDVPHILDVEPRRLDREALGETAHDRFATAVDRALTNDDADRLETLLDVSYDLEAWAPLDLAAERDDLSEALE
ncbi:uncharacterized protein Nmag_2621 [Natrialba magadii ATCC 43099]|uniref:Uncharacterized protein n=1 Tax=Natrialba magadii (strain ATCC 43099 / DSM 3394 / CCM 3739 / CIP 104546 / IAM 13178 / JCM 8861 / NBRC 102185 / NCIMB 2190 / MS3) TaxID=547559 RepID=D3SYY8_NATMM|nr:hypothetical protein [Natrialba magadii]ADD06180.1 uncharacterized protein Nmag_2621 [Natrialba magadii ATCC 43099]ELY30821.1 hypothetical protein C500_07283 [Natrialba magadii ATCC 43099]